MVGQQEPKIKEEWGRGYSGVVSSFFLYETSPGRNNEPRNSRMSNRRISKGCFLRHSTFIVRYSIFFFEVSFSIKLAALAAGGQAVFCIPPF
jgi:hypothetical protein